MIHEAIQYLEGRCADLEQRIGHLEVRGDKVGADELLAEYVHVSDLIIGLREHTHTKRMGVGERVRPKIRRLLADGKPRSALEITADIGEEPVSASTVRHVLSNDEERYTRVGTRRRHQLWTCTGLAERHLHRVS